MHPQTQHKEQSEERENNTVQARDLLNMSEHVRCSKSLKVYM